MARISSADRAAAVRAGGKGATNISVDRNRGIISGNKRGGSQFSIPRPRGAGVRGTASSGTGGGG